jgi:hypothetical protein
MQTENETNNSDGQVADEAVAIPHQRLAADTLQAVIEEYITRDGTDYGDSEVSLQAKVLQAMKKLESGEVKIVFYPASAHCQIVEAEHS